ncbi:MAG: transporter substrate-binding domain-containing protein [Bacteroidota bacterium]
MRVKSLLRFVLLLSLLFSFTRSGNASQDTLIIGYAPAPPFIITNQNDPPHGVSIWLWENVAADLGLVWRYQALPFSDVIDGLGTGDVDISINPLTMTAERSKSFGFTSPFYVANATAVVPAGRRWQQIRATLQALLSAEVFGAFFLLLVIILLFGWLTWIFERRQNPEQFRPDRKGLWDGLWWSAVTMTTVGYGDKAPRSFGGKIIALIWMFVGLLFISGLTASIASSIISVRDTSTYLTLDALRDRPIGTMTATSTETYLRSRFFRDVQTYSSIYSGFEAVETGEIDAFLYDEPILQYRLLEKQSDVLRVAPIQFNLQLYSFGVSKGRDSLSHLISERVLHYTSSIEWSVLLSEYEMEVL